MLVILIVASIMYLDVQTTSSRVTFLLYTKKNVLKVFTLFNGFADRKTSPLEELQIVFTLNVAK
jgi:hypothetical protein